MDVIPLLVFTAATLTARALGAAAIDALDDWTMAFRVGLSVVLLLTTSAHFGSRRADLVQMMSPQLSHPGLLATDTALAEPAVAAGLLVHATAPASALVLAVLLVLMFTANVHAAQAGIGIGGRPPTPIVPRGLMQVVFVAAAAAVYLGGA